MRFFLLNYYLTILFAFCVTYFFLFLFFDKMYFGGSENRISFFVKESYAYIFISYQFLAEKGYDYYNKGPYFPSSLNCTKIINRLFIIKS